jgi:hypothetical protein
MFSNRLAFAALGISCVAAAAGGGYVATRHNVADHPPAMVATSEGPSDSAQPVPASQPPSAGVTGVQETEGVVGEPSRLITDPAATPTIVEPSRPQANARPVQPASTARSTTTHARVEQRVSSEHGTAATATPSQPSAPDAPPVAHVEERQAEPAVAPEPPQSTFEELTVTADSVIGLQTETTLSSERARVEDRVEARVVRDVRAGGRVAVPAGARALGSVVTVERGGKLRTRARLGIRFHTLALADGTRVPITTETIYRYGDEPGNGSAAKIGGGAVAGAILGAILGGGKGAAIGATTGAAGGGAAVMTGDRSEAVFPAGAELTARILSPVTVTVDR